MLRYCLHKAWLMQLDDCFFVVLFELEWIVVEWCRFCVFPLLVASHEYGGKGWIVVVMAMVLCSLGADMAPHCDMQWKRC